MTRKEKIFVLRMICAILYCVVYRDMVSEEKIRRFQFLVSDVEAYLDGEYGK